MKPFSKTLLTISAMAAIGLGTSISAANAQRAGDLTTLLPAVTSNPVTENLVQVHRKHKKGKRYSKKHYRKHHRYAHRHHKKRYKKARRTYHRHHHHHHTHAGIFPVIRYYGPAGRIIIYLH